MMFCIFKNNQDTLFYVHEGSLEVSHSFIEHSSQSLSYGAVSTSNNNSFTNTITYQLQFFNSLHCYADIPLGQRSLDETIRRTNGDTLRMTYERTIEQTIRDTLKETIHRSYAEFICTNQIANWREISVIFSFAFLYPVIILIVT